MESVRWVCVTGSTIRIRVQPMKELIRVLMVAFVAVVLGMSFIIILVLLLNFLISAMI